MVCAPTTHTTNLAVTAASRTADTTSFPSFPLLEHPSSGFWRVKSVKRFIVGLRAHRSLGIIYFSWHAARVARWRACKYYANIAQIRTEDVSGLAWHICRQGSFTIVPGK